ncbi:hypothetical protein [Bacillus sp. 166amftsu]|uniref:hypothetical protein n=1 Tax=Bacillus sp. 166amftsu TaxID=1761753 RepID=UPI001FCD1259|nr:hypothetical protein [Bacillus sp. 166amftsu]
MILFFIKIALKGLKTLNVGSIIRTLQLQKRKVCNKKDIRTVICLNIFLGSYANSIDYNKEKIILYKVNETEEYG